MKLLLATLILISVKSVIASAACEVRMVGPYIGNNTDSGSVETFIANGLHVTSSFEDASSKSVGSLQECVNLATSDTKYIGTNVKSVVGNVVASDLQASYELTVKNIKMRYKDESTTVDANFKKSLSK